MDKNKKLIILICVIFIFAISILLIKINIMRNKYETQISLMKESYNSKLISLNTFKNLYEDTEKELLLSNKNLENVNKEFTDFKNTVAMSQEQEKTLSRGEDYNITKFPIITEDELNKWIESKAPSDSPFIGKASVFIKAANESGLDPKFIFSLAAVESSYGRSQIAREKGNYFGILAYNHAPYENAKSFSSELEEGIVDGAMWVANNFKSDSGSISVNSMQYRSGGAYSQNADGSANTSWIRQVVNIMN